MQITPHKMILYRFQQKTTTIPVIDETTLCSEWTKYQFIICKKNQYFTVTKALYNFLQDHVFVIKSIFNAYTT